jgi:hypothetical protein
MARKIDANGNPTKGPSEHWTKLTRNMLETPAWRALSPTAQALYVWFKLEWKGPRANNNGKIRFSVRQAAHALGVARDTAARAIHDLQAKGFLVMTEKPSLGLEGAAKSPAFELTEIPLPSAGRNEGRKLYREWQRGHDFSVPKVASNNPVGRNGKETCHKNRDVTVTEFRTVSD